jgi:hypothetical protein
MHESRAHDGMTLTRADVIRFVLQCEIRELEAEVAKAEKKFAPPAKSSR